MRRYPLAVDPIYCVATLLLLLQTLAVSGPSPYQISLFYPALFPASLGSGGWERAAVASFGRFLALLPTPPVPTAGPPLVPGADIYLNHGYESCGDATDGNALLRGPNSMVYNVGCRPWFVASWVETGRALSLRHALSLRD